jgi:RecA-family ATPase
VLARPAEPPQRIDGLMAHEAGMLLIAQRKTGKTSFGLNLARCLVTGDDFLGRFPVRPLTGRVALLNYEVSAAQLGR